MTANWTHVRIRKETYDLLTKAQARHIGHIGKVVSLIDYTDEVIHAGIEAIEKQDAVKKKK
jgi:hypothetical protein